MVVFNYSGKEVSAKIVYYGPGLSGKTTNLEQIYGKVPDTQRGKMVSMKTKTDRTLFFDFLPLSAGEINGFRTRFLLYTVPGQVYYNATRKLVLKGSDGVVFVADSDPELRDANLESFANLEKNLGEYGMDLQNVPIVLQFNKRDVPNAMTIEALHRDLNRGNWPHIEAVAIRGQGVFETFKEITRLVFKKMNERVDRRAAKGDPMGEGETGKLISSAPIPSGLREPSDSWEGPSVGHPVSSAPAASDSMIHLTPGDRILGGAAQPPAPAPAPAPAPEPAPAPIASAEIVRAAEMIGQTLPTTRAGDFAAAPQPAQAAPPESPPPQAELPAPPAEIARTAELIARVKPVDDSQPMAAEEPVHRIRVPVTLSRAALGRFQIILDIEVIEPPTGESEDGGRAERKTQIALSLDSTGA